ncbi:PASTA domain-containing protein [Paenibacillus roseipurpureus]|uniref:PASTA domain-containing protein n=1 Tax=Paenibacillus roseopurpureus TaxID=2918901 RepID=A0AA96LS58_9BACL|nr:PASTA domain-containing protein [Paenibacillus sp. MBLB1832]WNR46298.1 PASTA domain-containing protein [Paenibacillus sp. MBLB1832]
MSDRIGSRYVPSTQIVSFPHGTLHYGDDVFLSRKVLLYRKTVRHPQHGDIYIRSLHDKAAFIHDGFHHILDTSVSEDAVTIILQAKSGSLFSSLISNRKWPFSAVVEMISDLGVSLLDALEERITGFSVRPENLWLSDHNKLSVINYWEDDEDQEQSAIGLCRLMIGLLTGGEPITDTFEVMHTTLERTPIPSATMEQKQALIRVIKFICHGQSSLSSLVFGLRSLPPTITSTTTVASAESSSREQDWVMDSSQPPDPLPPPRDLDDVDRIHNNHTFAKVALSAATTLVVGGIVVWAVWPSSSPKIVEKVVIVSPSPTASIVTTASPSASAKPVLAGADSEETVVPNLVGQTQEAAEKMALAAGLHYNFFIEASTLPKGTVSKQDPKPGTNSLQGENVTFWVSKGSQ